MEESAESARKLVRAALVAWQLEELAEAGSLVVTELVANSVQQTNSRHIQVAVLRRSEGFVRIAVADSARIAPTMAQPAQDLPTSGRGLLIISALAEHWGTDIHRFGKQVWAELVWESAA
ncbi:ATP-binding protein [Streptomyces sp. NPDC101152]|uniref:ATP-binding protein n=1 Tax=Streptomyces sp. NPDC101152 TaxID=3366116 RepID=UPI0037F6C818